ncbi:MAG TPA: hypothetical protein VKA44_00600, partial [Gemmatimonadota bacterium]|nr:hypothetical protein [Gemmatimonadota bacterium]
MTDLVQKAMLDTGSGELRYAAYGGKTGEESGVDRLVVENESVERLDVDASGVLLVLQMAAPLRIE